MMAEAQKSEQNQSGSSESRVSTNTSTSTKSSTTTDPQENTQEYVLLDLEWTRQVDGKPRKFSQGQRVTLNDLEATKRLRGPRPSVRRLTDEEKNGGS